MQHCYYNYTVDQGVQIYLFVSQVKEMVHRPFSAINQDTQSAPEFTINVL